MAALISGHGSGGSSGGRRRGGRWRRSAVLAVLPAMVALAVPAGAAARADGEPAAEGQLAVHTLDRHGAPTHTMVDVAVLGSPGVVLTSVWSDVSYSLPVGHYAIVSSIADDGDPWSATLDARPVDVTANATTDVTVDARQGRELRIGWDGAAPGADYQRDLSARVCVEGWGAGGAGLGAVEAPSELFVIPQSDPRFSLGYGALWESSTSKDGYAAAGTVPVNGDPITVSAASTGTVHTSIRVGPLYDTYGADDVSAKVTSEGCQHDLYLGSSLPSAPLPSERTFHLTPGEWRFIRSSWYGDETVATGSLARVDIGRAVWGPARYLPWVHNGELGFYTTGMVADPLLSGVESTIVADATLYRDGRKIVTRTGLGDSASTAGPKTFWAPVAASGAYTLKVHGHRFVSNAPPPAGMMSTATDAAFSFHAGPASDAVPPAFLVRFLPTGLDLSNRLPAGHAAGIELTLDRTSTQAGVPMWPATAKKVEVFGSTDGGRAWHPLTVAHSGAGWQTTLPAQHTGVELSLSARVTDVGGNQTVTTVYRAFTVH